MRNPDRIDLFCTEMAKIWKEEVPDWRFGQLMINFLSWLGQDPFYMEDNKFMDKFHEFIDSLL